MDHHKKRAHLNHINFNSIIATSGRHQQSQRLICSASLACLCGLFDDSVQLWDGSVRYSTMSCANRSRSNDDKFLPSLLACCLAGRATTQDDVRRSEKKAKFCCRAAQHRNLNSIICISARLADVCYDGLWTTRSSELLHYIHGCVPHLSRAKIPERVIISKNEQNVNLNKSYLKLEKKYWKSGSKWNDKLI